VALGYSVTPHLVLYFELLDAGAVDAPIKVNGADTGRPTLATDVIGYGPGVACYFGPNVFVAATLLFAKIELSDSGNNAILDDSKTGLALEALIGKEWWVSDNWGLGMSGQVVFGKMKGKDADVVLNEVPAWSATSISLLFSATYN